MPRTETHLNETDMKVALAYWVDAGCPMDGADPGRVSLCFSKAPGVDPREHDEYDAVVRQPSRIQSKD